MKKYSFIILLCSLIIQSENAYSCETSEKQARVLDQGGLKVVQQFKNFQQYSDQRQKEMREEAEMLRPSFDECRRFISANIRGLERERRDIESASLTRFRQVHSAHYQAYRNLKQLKVEDFYQRFASSGEINHTILFQLVESCVLVGKVMNESLKRQCVICTSDRDQALIVPKARMVRLTFLNLGLEDYELFNPFSPVSQLRTLFVTINSLLGVVIASIPRSVLLEAELQDVKATLPHDEGEAAENSCFEVQLREIKACAKLLELYASESEVQKLPYKFNTLSLQDQEFVTNLLAFRTPTSFQGS